MRRKMGFRAINPGHCTELDLKCATVLEIDMRQVTKEEAEAYRYGAYPAGESGVAYDPTRCAEEVFDLKAAVIRFQCPRRNGKGPDGLYCGIHARRYREEG